MALAPAKDVMELLVWNDALSRFLASQLDLAVAAGRQRAVHLANLPGTKIQVPCTRITGSTSPFLSGALTRLSVCRTIRREPHSSAIALDAEDRSHAIGARAVAATPLGAVSKGGT